jgi:GTP pyrophosphokinase
VKVVIYTDDRPGILNQLTSILSAESSNIRSLEARTDASRQDEAAIVDITMDVRDKKQLDRLVNSFRRIPGVRDIERVQQAP